MKKHYGLILLLSLFMAIGGYSQVPNPSDGHAGCGHDELPQKYHFDYSKFDHEAYAKFMEVTTIEDLGDDIVSDRTTPITVTFTNIGKVAVDRYWVANDKLIKYGEVKAGQTFQQSTRVGHKWVFKDRDITVGTYTANERNKTYVVSPMDDSCFEIPVDLVVVYKSDGTGNQSKAELYEKFDQMNKLCENSNWRVRFKIARFEEVYSDNYYSLQRDYDKMTEIRDQYTNYPKAVPLIQTGDTGTGGIAAVNWLAISRPQSVTTWLHEIGHFLGLHHTHAEFGEGKELVDGSNCSVAGDLICDTPATPDTWNLAYDCIYTGTERDPNGQLYRPDLTNVMGYSNGCTNDKVTLEQEKRLLFFLRNNYTEMNPCAAPITPSDCKFDLIAGRARDIGTGGGQTYVVGSNGQVFKRTTSSWEALPFDFEGTKLDVTENGIPWVISTNNRIYYYANNRWVRTNGGGIEIGCGGNEVYVVATNNRIYRRVNNDWQVLNNDRAKRIDVDQKGRLWVVGMNDRLYVLINNSFKIRGKFKVQDIGISGADQYLWVLDTTGASYEYIGKNIFRPGASLANSNYKGKNITVGNDNSVWILDQYGQIHRGTCKERSETEAPANLSAGTYSIISKQSNKALSLYGWGQNNGTNIIQWDNLGYENQQWVLEHLGDNVYTVTLKYSNKALDVTGVRTNNGANIHQWNYAGGNNQKWKIQPVGDGYYRLLAVHSGKALSIYRNLTTNGANIHQWEYVGASSQKWRFDEVGVGSRSRDRLKDLSGRTTLDQKVELDWYYHLPTQVNEVFSYTLQHYDEVLEEFVDVETVMADSYDDPNSVRIIFTHDRPRVGDNYYQVRIDFVNGDYDFSAYETIALAESTKPVTIAPNPAKEELRVNLSNFRSVGLQYFVMDMQGKEWSRGYYDESHSDLEIIDLSAYRNGNYFIYIKPETQKGFSQQFVVMKEY